MRVPPRRGEGPGGTGASTLMPRSAPPPRSLADAANDTPLHPRFAHLLPASGEKALATSFIAAPSPATAGEGGRRPGEGRGHHRFTGACAVLTLGMTLPPATFDLRHRYLLLAIHLSMRSSSVFIGNAPTPRT